MDSIFKSTRRLGRRYNAETMEAICEAQAHARGEIELGDGYVTPGIDLRKSIPEDNRWNVRQTTEFKSGLEHMILEGMDISGLEKVVNILANGGILPRGYRNRPLRTVRRGTHECLIHPDLILTYSIDEEGLILFCIGRRSRPSPMHR